MDSEIRLELRAQQRGDFEQGMHVRVSARLVAAASMLELSSMGLQDAIAQELVDNPALEADEVRACQVCGAPLHGSICPTCLRSQKVEPSSSYTAADDHDSAAGRVAASVDDFDPILLHAGTVTLGQRLLADLRVILPRRDAAIAEQLVGNLDERGYLSASLEEIAESLGVPLARVEAVLSALQTMEPAGVGARDLRECLLIQIDQLALGGVDCRVARALVADHLEALARHQLPLIARFLRVPLTEVEAAAEMVRLRLSPRPTNGHAGAEAVAEARSIHVMPDVVIVAQDGAFVVEVVESRRLNLRVGSAYEGLYRQANGLSPEERAHVRQYTARARLFVANVEQRRHTIKRVTEAIVCAQPVFLRRGVRHLVPLTRLAIAQSVGLDESTVSRATQGKHALLPDGSVIPFAQFFQPHLVVHDVMREILAGETRPLTDSGIRDELAGRGIRIARRTVAKYRAQLRVLPSGFRPRRPAQVA